jgi:hypothetical protein
MEMVRSAGVVFLFVMAICGSLTTATATAQQVSNDDGAVSLDRVKDGLARTPPQSLKFDARIPVPVATFRVTVEQKAFVEPILVTLRKEFELTPLQRQSAEWSSKCCGLSLAAVTESIEKAFRRWEERRIHDRVSRELAEVIAAGEK